MNDFSLERDLQRSDKIVDKVKNIQYAQALYAALCNNEWVHKDTMSLLKNNGFVCSWRYAGGIVANLRGLGDYLDFYCSSLDDDLAISEGFVTEEIKLDLMEIGWILKSD